jgi:aldehyde:ferredoxin oxidoreductase
MHHAVGPLLSVDATTRSATEESIDDTLAAFVGGRGVGTKLATDRVPFDADPLGPENALYLATGPLQFSQTSFTGRLSATGLSPLTDGLLSSNAGGFLSRHFTAAGYSAVEITGASDDLLAVHVRDDGVTFEAVPALAGATVPEVDEYMSREHGLGEDRIACIGPAGEHGVRFASIMTTESRAFGRGGLGAVLGAMGVKAITFDGETEPPVEIDFPEAASEIHREAATSDSPMKESGTTSVTEYANHVEALPSYYFSERSFEGADGISGDRVAEKKHEKATCSACAFACKLPTRDEATGLETEGPEFETVMAFGSNAGVDDIVSVMQSNDLCDRFGLDTISCGDVISAYLASEDAFGDDELIHELVRKIAYREGVGDLLAEGIARCHEDLGVENWTVKGLEFAAHDGRKLNGQGLAFAVANRGADHMYGEFYPYEYPLVGKDEALPPEGLDGKPPLLVRKENRNAVLDSAVVCKFSRGVITDERLADLLDTDYDRLQEIGARIVDLERAFNNRRGFDRADDTLPYDLPEFESALDEYYDERGWTEDGRVPDVGTGDDAAGDAASADD